MGHLCLPFGALLSGDTETVRVLEVIFNDEVGHVKLGTRWFHYLCRQRGLEPEQTYFDLLENFLGGDIRCPLHREARRRAGFSERELDRLESICAKKNGAATNGKPRVSGA